MSRQDTQNEYPQHMYSWRNPQKRMLLALIISVSPRCPKWVPTTYAFKEKSTKTYIVGTHYKCLAKIPKMSTHNICFHGEVRKISILLDWKKHLIKSYGWNFGKFVSLKIFVHDRTNNAIFCFHLFLIKYNIYDWYWVRVGSDLQSDDIGWSYMKVIRYIQKIYQLVLS